MFGQTCPPPPTAHGPDCGPAPVRPKPTPPSPPEPKAGADPWAGGNDPWAQARSPQTTPAPAPKQTQPTVPPPRLRRQQTPPPEAFDPSVIVRPEGPPSVPSAPARGAAVAARQLPVPAWVERQAAGQAPATAPAPQPRQWLQQEATQASAPAPAADAGPGQWLRQEAPPAPVPEPAAKPRQQQPEEAKSQAPPARPAPAAQEVPTVQSAETSSAAGPAPGKPLLAVPETGFQDVNLAQAKRPFKTVHTFAITVFRATAEQRLGIRVENVRGAGYDSAARVHRIFEGGMIDKWNSTQIANGLPTWVVRVDDVIVGLNGRHEFTPTSAEVQTATMLNLLIVRGFSCCSQ